MKHSKRILTVFIVLLLVFSQTGCSVTEKIKDIEKSIVSETQKAIDKTQSIISENESVIDEALNDTESSTDDADKSDNVVVTDALSYEKDVIVAPEYKEQADELKGYKHKIYLPKITSDTHNATDFNNEIYNEYSKFYDTLKNDKEENLIFDIEYKYKIYDNVIGIIVYDYVGEQFAGISTSYHAYYFNVKDDKEITFDEYLSQVGFTKDTLQDRISKTDAYLNTGTENGEITACILDTVGTIACCETEESMDGWIQLTTEPIV